MTFTSSSIPISVHYFMLPHIALKTNKLISKQCSIFDRLCWHNYKRTHKIRYIRMILLVGYILNTYKMLKHLNVYNNNYPSEFMLIWIIFFYEFYFFFLNNFRVYLWMCWYLFYFFVLMAKFCCKTEKNEKIEFEIGKINEIIAQSNCKGNKLQNVNWSWLLARNRKRWSIALLHES